ncbi:MAG: SDR family oxidoreductase [bacterium]|nr:SDR family oxidoreductase [bacterium]
MGEAFETTDEFEGRVAFITGTASGIGRAASRLFAARGARVVLADIDREAGASVAEEIRQTGAEAVFVETDVADDAAVGRAVATATERFGRLDYAYNNAGLSGPPNFVADMPEEQWRRTIDVMLTGVFLCMKHQIPAILAAGGGAIVNCASGAGLIGFPGQSAYVASKHGVIGLTRAAALEYGSQGIRVNSICPGTARTAMVEDVVRETPALQQELEALHPIGRIAEPEEIAEAALWLCSERSSFVLGAALSVDGGYVAQ